MAVKQADRAVRIVTRMGERIDTMQAASERSHKQLNRLGVPRGKSLCERLDMIKTITLRGRK